MDDSETQSYMHVQSMYYIKYEQKKQQTGKSFTSVALKTLQLDNEDVATGLWSSKDFLKKHVHASMHFILYIYILLYRVVTVWSSKWSIR